MKNEKTSARVASEASDQLRDRHSSREEKSVAGSALTQAPDHGKKRTETTRHHNKKTTC